LIGDETEINGYLNSLGPMRIVLWGTYDTGKPRVRLLREGIRRIGFELIECHADIWGNIEDKSQVQGSIKKLKLVLSCLISYPILIWRYLRLPAHELVLVSYPGLIDVLLIRCFAWLRRTPVVWDVFISIYDTLVLDRRMIRIGCPVEKLLWSGEWLALRAADGIFMDTRAHARRLEALFKLSDNICGTVWVGAETEKFPSVTQKPSSARRVYSEKKPLHVLYYGQFIPLHGIDHIIEAARLLCEANVNWILIGRGQEAAHIREMLDQVPLPRLHWIEWVEYAELIKWIEQADLCLGIFGTSEKAASVIPNKVFQVISAGKPIVTRDSPAIRELLHHAPPCVYLVREGSATAIADAIHDHMTQFDEKWLVKCHRELEHGINANAIGIQFREYLMTRSFLRGNNAIQ
jgi:glycosyltransferase involved in cell wall biosynthesis